MSEVQPFLLLSNADRAAWRSETVTERFLVHLADLVNYCRVEIQLRVRERKTDDAFILAGKLEALEEVITLACREDREPEVENEEDPDPAPM